VTRLLTLVLAALLVAGCDITGTTKKTPPPKTLSHAQFVHAANRACARFERRAKRLKPSRNIDRVVAQDRRIVVPAFERLLFELRGLEPPTSEAAAFRRMLATLNEEDIVVHNLLDAVDARQPGQVRRLLRRSKVLSKRLESRSAKVGLRHCGKASQHR
jgi:hypothetical protein